EEEEDEEEMEGVELIEEAEEEQSATRFGTGTMPPSKDDGATATHCAWSAVVPSRQLLWKKRDCTGLCGLSAPQGRASSGVTT
ncbi:MAG: hypothetical protein AAGN64_12590, partial [Bacteroidota bacterium]